MVLRAGGVSANLCGRIRLAQDGEDPDALRLVDCGCHLHLAWHEVEEFQLRDVDVGYGAEPTLVIAGRNDSFRLQVHFPQGEAGRFREAFAHYAMAAIPAARAAAPICLAPLPITGSRPRDRRASEQLLTALEALGVCIRFPGGEDWRARDSLSLEDRYLMLEAAWRDGEVTHIWAALGGYGAARMIEQAQTRLGPPRGDKTLIGASDISQLGVWLAAEHAGAGFVHGLNFEDEALWSVRRDDLQQLLQIILGVRLPPRSFSSAVFRSLPTGACVAGAAVPVNATAARSLACRGIGWTPPGSILFLEDVNEPLPRLARLFDDLAATGLFERVAAVVLGTFSEHDEGGVRLHDAAEVADLLHDRSAVPIVALAEFGHTACRLPIVAGAPVEIAAAGERALVTLSFARPREALAA